MPKRYYDYDTLRGAMHDVILGNGAKHRCIDAGAILDLPQADVVEVKYAYDEDGESVASFTCSACKWFCGDLYEGDEVEGKGWNSYNWCPNCGAKIRRKEDVKTNRR